MKGEEIAKKRNALKYTQEELAKKLGISRRTLQSYEKGGIIPESRKEILRNFLYGNVEGNNISVGNNSGNIAGGNIIQLTLPEAGTQKIIKPDGTILIEPISSNEKETVIDDLMKDKQDLLEKIDLQTELIKSLKEQIALLKR